MAEKISFEWQKHPLKLIREGLKSYHYIYADNKIIGFFSWHFQKNIWVWNPVRHRKKKKKKSIKII